MRPFSNNSRSDPDPATPSEAAAMEEYFDNGGQSGDCVRMEGNVFTGYRLVKTGHDDGPMEHGDRHR